MIGKDITFMTYGTATEAPKEVTRTYYFHLSKMDIIHYAVKHKGGIKGMLEEMIQEKDEATLLATLEEFILMSYGVRSEDGEEFDKSPELLTKFKKSAAYSALFDQFLGATSVAGAMADFINGLFPPDMIKASEEAIAAAGGDVQKALEAAKVSIEAREQQQPQPS